MRIYQAFYLIFSVQLHPAAPADWVHFTSTFPGKGKFLIPDFSFDISIKGASHEPKLEIAEMI